MKKILVLSLAVMFVLGATVSFAAREGAKGADAKAYEHASDNSIFNRVGDWFATVGKSDEEKARIKAERKAERQAKRMEKETKEKTKAVKEKVQKEKKTMNQKMEKGKKNLDKKMNKGR